ncbi:MAG: hypothetical protein QF831_01140, partial [Candidatus Thalassarchaeaceae archaeon]|nr:hypothetical protein [Candidatus Thalassarchaeaceae archaeon]
MSDFSIGDLSPEISQCGLSIDGPVANITLQREKVFNALNPELISELCALLDWCSERSVGTRGQLVDGDGEAFLRVIVL